jgi:hypothetical protein
MDTHHCKEIAELFGQAKAFRVQIQCSDGELRRIKPPLVRLIALMKLVNCTGFGAFSVAIQKINNLQIR